MFFLPTKLDIITTRFADVGFLTMSLGVPQIDTEFGFCHWMSGRRLWKSLKVSIPLSIIKQNGVIVVIHLQGCYCRTSWGDVHSISSKTDLEIRTQGQSLYLGMVLGSTSKGMRKSNKKKNTQWWGWNFWGHLAYSSPRFPVEEPVRDWRWADSPTRSFPFLGDRELHSQSFQASLCWRNSQSTRTKSSGQEAERRKT